jgi:hypothetical protein
MATINKDFKIKSGLIVEGTTATVNGYDILTKNPADDQHIIDLIGGETLVKSVTGNLSVDGAGALSLDQNSLAGEMAGDYITTSGDNLNVDIASLATDLINNEGLATSSGVSLTLESYTPTADLDTTVDGYGYLKSADLAGYATETYADNAAAGALEDAQTYADAQIDDALTSSVKTWSSYKTSTEIGLAQAAAETHADEAVAALVDSAPAMLDTLNELAAALQDNPDVITDLQNVAAGKQDTLTAGSNIDITGATISVTGLDTDDVVEGSNLYFTNQRALDATSAAYDAAGAASTAESNANSYTDTSINGLDTDDIEEGINNLYYTDARAEYAARQLLLNADKTNIEITWTDPVGPLSITAENGVADSTTDDLSEGETNLYFTDTRVIDAVSGANITPNTVTIDTYRKEEATQQYVSTASTVTVHELTAGFESAKYLVRVVGNVAGARHSQLSEILMTVDGGGNIAITEYGTTHTSDSPLASFSATSGPNGAALTATTAVSGCEVIVAATMLSWAD